MVWFDDDESPLIKEYTQVGGLWTERLRDGLKYYY